MRKTAIIPKVGDTKTKTFFAWLPVSVYSTKFIEPHYKNTCETRWMEKVTVCYKYMISWDGSVWEPIAFL